MRGCIPHSLSGFFYCPSIFLRSSGLLTFLIVGVTVIREDSFPQHDGGGGASSSPASPPGSPVFSLSLSLKNTALRTEILS